MRIPFGIIVTDSLTASVFAALLALCLAAADANPVDSDYAGLVHRNKPAQEQRVASQLPFTYYSPTYS